MLREGKEIILEIITHAGIVIRSEIPSPYNMMIKMLLDSFSQNENCHQQ